MLALCGCATEPPPIPERTAPPTASPAPAPISLLPQTPVPPQRPPVTPRKRDERKPATPPPSPVQLVGLNETELQTLLGMPAAVENHSPGKTLRFRKQDCVLSLALYPDIETRIFRTLSYEVTSDDNNVGATQQCQTKFGAVAATE